MKAQPDTSLDRQFMSRAIELAAGGLYTADPNPRVGCVLVSDNQVIGEGFHRRAGQPHAEIEALQACRGDVAGATVYVTLEPCAHQGRTPPCADALVAAGVARVVVGGVDPNPQVAGAGLQRLTQAGIVVQSGLMQRQCEALNPGFLSRWRRARPYVRVKLAASLDGRTALANGHSQWITGAEARRDVQHWRARAGCILTGIGTVLADDPRLDVRLEPADYGAQLPVRQPLLAIMDTRLRTPADARLFSIDRQSVVYTKTPNNKALYDKCEVIHDNTGGDASGVDIAFVLNDLAARQINEVHVEAGPVLTGALLRAGVIDELVVYIAPHLLGRDARELCHFDGLTSMDDRPAFRFVDVIRVGTDVRLTLTPEFGT